MAKAKKTVVRKRRAKKNVARGVAHIHSTFNNTIVTITDEAGNRYNITYNSDNRISTISQFNKNYLSAHLPYHTILR